MKITFHVRKRGSMTELESDCGAFIHSSAQITSPGHFYELIEQSPELCCEICMKAFLQRNQQLDKWLSDNNITGHSQEDEIPFVTKLKNKNNERRNKPQ
jgi:hypothetical protein